MHIAKRFFITFALLAFTAFFAVAPATAQTQPLGPYGSIPFLTGNTAIDTVTLLAPQMVSILTGTPTAAASYTTPTATLLCGMFPFVASQAAAGYSWDLWVKNTSGGANTITMLAGSGVTLVGTMTAAQNSMRWFKVVLNECRVGSTAAAQLVSMGTVVF